MSSLTREVSVTSPAYQLTEPNTLLFVTGTTISGKSTVSPLVASSIEGCNIQSMDILRLAAQQIDAVKPAVEQSPFVHLGACDSYLAIDDGEYTVESLIEGFNLYSMAVFAVAQNMIPKLEVQGAQNVMFEGVQLTPRLVKPYLRNNNRLIILETDEGKLAQNRKDRYGEDQAMYERYALPVMMLLQDEIITQAQDVDQRYVFRTENMRDPIDAAVKILAMLLDDGIITERSKTA